MKLKKIKIMKTVKSIFKIALYIILIYSIPAYAIDQDEKIEKFESSYKLSLNGKLGFKVYESDLNVNTWKNSEVKLVGEIIYTGGDVSDRDLLLKAFKNPEVKNEINSLEINTEFWKNMNSNALSTTITLIDGEKIKLTKFKVRYTLWIPESIVFELESKYNNVELSDFKGISNFDLYDVNMHVGNFGDNSVIDAKYSELNLGNGGNATFKIYDCKITALGLKNIDIESKYSTFEASSVNELKIDSYDDDFDIKNLAGFQAKASYSTFILGGQISNSNLELYDTDVRGGSYGVLIYNAKYSDLIADKIGNLTISSIYNCNIKIGQVETFSCDNSQYNEITFGIATGSIKMPDTYDTKLTINKLSSSFYSFTGGFQYGSVSLITDPVLNYKLSFVCTYGSIIYPKERFSNNPLVYIEKDNETKFESSTDKDAKCEISFTAYDLNFKII